MHTVNSLEDSYMKRATSTLVGQPVQRTPISTRFGNMVDVRSRGALRVMRLVGIQTPASDTPAVVRLWSGETCRELSVNEARALASQLTDAATHAELQNGC
jgi:hypothetical protein